jgi:hypothetical protein
MRDPKLMHNDQPVQQLDTDGPSGGFLPWLIKMFPEIAMVNVLHRNRNVLFILERFKKLDEVSRVLSQN